MKAILTCDSVLDYGFMLIHAISTTQGFLAALPDSNNAITHLSVYEVWLPFPLSAEMYAGLR
ncbi:hypothetical protein SAMN05216516_103223 [Izhakiella capsodis]|uniref:Uncharacterized protein n=1 Tax=Izhakiella capsodis TaxID=1367852 RepID=A0A1I4X2X4_9GAMM|nr:hypothetical protein SAMN05216516_103223 [Izhakiella capsodis]